MSNLHFRFRYTIPVFITTCLMFSLPGCDKLDMQPGEFAYPLEISVTQNQSVATLHWTEATVSTFEEYVILRSTDRIPDTPEPQVTANTLIIARVDQRSGTTLEDINVPIVDTIFYKVYANIGDRFLMSPTIAYDTHLHVLSFRADAMEAVPSKHEMVAVDRALNTLFVYDYQNREILRTKALGQLSGPLIHVDLPSKEIMVADNGYLSFYDYNSLALNQSFFTGYFRDVQFGHGWIYLLRAQPPYSFALYRRFDVSSPG